MKRTGRRVSRSKPPARGGELLLEIGVEELPYQFIAPALAWLTGQTAYVFESNNLQTGPIKTYGTPRRLVVVVEQLAAHQKPSRNEAMGPPKAIAYDQTGQPTKAAIGFAKAQGVPVESLQVRETPRGEYLFAIKEDRGRPTKKLLPELLPQIIGELSFPKAMKWNHVGVLFARPIRWMVAIYAGKVVPVKFAGIRAGNRTYGHRVMSGGKPLAVRDFGSYSNALKRAGVLVDQDRRRSAIETQIDRLCSKTGVDLNKDESLLDQAVFTTEWPYAVVGSFKPEYLTLPSEILITSMKGHQGFFSIRDKKTGQLAPHFIAVANNQLKDMSLIRVGNERVLSARLADAKFFFDEDRKIPLEARVKKLEGVTFHQKVGTMAQKRERLVKLVSIVGSLVGTSAGFGSQISDFIAQCRKAAELCKADLLTGIVGEFPELQGIMGGEYARREGVSDYVWKAIRDQYIPVGMEAQLPETLEGLALSLADKVDTIVAFLNAGITPKGSEDPYALRRHALSIVRMIVEGNLRLPLDVLVEHSEEIVESQVRNRPSMLHSPLTFIFERFRFYAGKLHIKRDDVISAVCETAYSRKPPLDLVDILERMKSLQAVTAKPDFDPLIVGFKRASRIVEKEQWEPAPVDPDRFQDPAEGDLHRRIGVCRADVHREMAEGRYDKALEALVGLKPAIDTFFTNVMVNVEDAGLRGNRLSLLKDVKECFTSFADFSRIVVQGT